MNAVAAGPMPGQALGGSPGHVPGRRWARRWGYSPARASRTFRGVCLGLSVEGGEERAPSRGRGALAPAAGGVRGSRRRPVIWWQITVICQLITD
jgi:hypothetical protein